MPVRAVRGAITVEADSERNILEATGRLLEGILVDNPSMQIDDVASGIFTMTEDLRSVYPAKAARDLGWTQVALLCAQEIPVPGALPQTIRVLLHWNTDLPQSGVNHVYLGDAGRLRPDLAQSNSAQGAQERQVSS